MEEIFESGNDLGKFLDSYRQIAVTLNGFQEKEIISVSKLAELANVHWSTAKKALLFFDAVKLVIPEFEILKDLRFRITAKSSAFKAVRAIFGSSEMRVLTKMMLCKAMDAENARSLEEVLDSQEMEVLPKLISNGFINSIDGLYYLGRRGISIGGLGLKKLVDSGIKLPWQETATVVSKPSLVHMPKEELRIETVGTPIYPQRLYGDISTEDSVEWHVNPK